LAAAVALRGVFERATRTLTLLESLRLDLISLLRLEVGALHGATLVVKKLIESGSIKRMACCKRALVTSISDAEVPANEEEHWEGRIQ
jgi:hypothetical protein